MKNYTTNINISITCIYLISLYIHITSGNGNIETISYAEKITSSIGIFLFPINLVIILPISLIISVILKKLTWKIFFKNIILLLIQFIICYFFVALTIARSAF
jgi:uncharacterized protein YacL